MSEGGRRWGEQTKAGRRVRKGEINYKYSEEGRNKGREEEIDTGKLERKGD